MNPRSERDEWLMAQVAAGRRDHLEPLVRRYACPLLTFIRRMLGDHHRAEEVFQEVFLSVWCKRHLYEFPRSFKSWLYAIAVNACHAAQRSPAVRCAGLEEPELAVAASPTPEDQVIAAETALLVSAAVAQLPAQQRAVVVLRVWQGLSYAEIADIVERSEGTVRSHMHHGLNGLRKYLEPRLV